MIPSLREPPFFLGDLGERLPRKDEIPPPAVAEEVAPGVWRGPDGKLFTQLETPEEPPLDPYEELAKVLMAKTPLKRVPKIGDMIRILTYNTPVYVKTDSEWWLETTKATDPKKWEFVS